MRTINTRKSYLIVLFALFVGLITQIAVAGAKLSVEKKGTYTYWMTFKDAEGVDQSTTPARFKGSETEINTKLLGPKFSDAKLHVLDKRTGNAAVMEYKAPEDPKNPADIDVKSADFQYVPSVQINVASEDGAPLSTAKVVLADGEGTKMLKVITPADKGIAVFSDVAIGDVEVKIAADGVKKTLEGEFELPEKRESTGFERQVKVTGDVDTLAVAKTAKETPKTETKTSASVSVLQTIVGLLFFAILIAIIVVVVKSKGFTSKSALQKMGVSVPGDQPVGMPGIVGDPNACQFCGQTKDAAGNCACSVSGSASPFIQTPAGPSGPRLIGSQGTYSGNIFMLSGNTAVIGREASNDVALPNDTTASRRHATLTASNGSYTIKDEGSSNGTFVNGARITSQTLMPGDEVQIGATKFRFEI